MTQTNEKIIHREGQLSLIEITLKREELLRSNIISSVVPSIGRKFAFADLEKRKHEILQSAREQILSECSLPETSAEDLLN